MAAILHRSDESILDRLRTHAQTQPDRLAYRFLHDDARSDTLTFGQLDRRVRGLAAYLREHAAPGERALLLYPPGLDFIEAFLACLAAQVIAVPAYPPLRNRKAERLRAITEDAQPRLALTTGTVQPTLETAELANAKGLLCLATDGIDVGTDDGSPLPRIAGGTVALLQYTSGSTGTPRGVIITHDNLNANERAIEAAFQHTQESVGVNWLPVFHDMGLIGNILQPLFVGFPSILLAPYSFLQQPGRWLRAITEYRATTAGAPNFAYDHCVRNINEAQKEELDLRSWQVAYNGAEPVRAETMDRFTAAFADRGFRKEAFFPCYGLAEATLFVSGGPVREEPRRRYVKSASLEAGHIAAAEPNGGRWLVGSGRPAEGAQVVAVDPGTRTAVPQGRVGELWVASPSVAAGYWGHDGESSATFENYLSSGQGPFLSTGDLGFLDSGEVFVTGRSKDLIIIRGRNIYPQDVEASIGRVLPFVQANSCAAVAIDGNNQERLGIVIEADRGLVRIARTSVEGNGLAEAAIMELAMTVRKVREVISDEFQVLVHAVAFVRPGSFPRTSSGKLQRRSCLEGLRDQTLDLIHIWEEPAGALKGQKLEVAEEPEELSAPTTDPRIPKNSAHNAAPDDGKESKRHKRKPWTHQGQRQKWYAFANIALPIIGMTALAGLMRDNWLSQLDIGLLVGMYAFTVVGITVGFHRHFTHAAFKTTPVVRGILAVAGSMAGEGSLVFWVATHRRHHQYSDEEGDPHSPHLQGSGYLSGLYGLWYGHVGWMGRHKTVDTALYAKDLLRDPSMVWISRMYIWLVLSGLVIPAAIAGLVTQTWIGVCRGLFWGGFCRMFLAHQFTWSVNSICHTFGSKEFHTGDHSVNNIWLAIPTWGESWHNNHHASPSAASFSRRWWQLDIGAVVIHVLEAASLAWDVKRVKSNTRVSIADGSADPFPQPFRTVSTEPGNREASDSGPGDMTALDARETIHSLINQQLRAVTGSQFERIDYDRPFAGIGLDSVGVAVVSMRLSQALGISVSPAAVYEYNTVDRLAGYILGCSKAGSPLGRSRSCADQGNHGITVRFVTQSDERELVYHFRYMVYVEEMHRTLPNADHTRKRIVESLDVDGRILAAFDMCGDVVGTLRTNLLRESDLGEFRQRYGLDQLPPNEAIHCSVSTRNLVAREYRSSAIEWSLIRCNYEMLLAEGIKTNYAACTADLLPFYIALGYTARRRFDDPDTGPMYVICFDFENLEHLRAIGSPLFSGVESLMRQQASECRAGTRTQRLGG